MVADAQLFKKSGFKKFKSKMALTQQSLMPTKWNTVITVGKEITPFLSTNLSAIYTPGTILMILIPSIRYNLADNLDFDVVWQSFFAEQYNEFEGVYIGGFYESNVIFNDIFYA
jgi:hypothetical protein